MENTVVLKSGEELFAPIVSVIYLTLQELLKKQPIAFIELVSLARNPKHELFADTGDILKDLKLIESDMSIPKDVRLVILAASEGEGLGLRLVSPVKEKCEQISKETQRLCSLDDAECFALAHEVANCIFEQLTKALNEECFSDRRRQPANPYYNQTASGFFLELYYGGPSKLWTPWGSWKVVSGICGTAEDVEDVVDMLIKRFGATVHISETEGFGPVYALHAIDSKALPRPLELSKSAYASYEEAVDAWRKLS